MTLTLKKAEFIPKSWRVLKPCEIRVVCYDYIETIFEQIFI